MSGSAGVGWIAVAGLIACALAACAGEPPSPPAALVASEPAVKADRPPCGAGALDDGGVCVPAACGRGRFGDVAIEGAVYVDPAAAAGGDGSRGAPLAGLDEALAAAIRRGAPAVVLADGRHPGPLVPGAGSAGVRVVGRCAARVVIDGAGGEPAAAVQIGPVTRPRDGGAALELAGVTVQHGAGIGVAVRGGALRLRDVRVEGCGDAGVEVRGGGVLDAERLTVERATACALRVAGSDSEARLAELTVRDTRPDADGFGLGLDVRQGARATVDGGRFEALPGGALYAGGAGTTLTLRDLTIRDTRERDAENPGLALFADDRAAVVARRCRWHDNAGEGAVVYAGATLDLRDSALRGGVETGLRVKDPGSRASLRRVLVHGTRPRHRGDWCAGVHVTQGGALDARACVIDDNAEANLLVHDPGSRATLWRVALTGSGGDRKRPWGIGAYVALGGALALVDGALAGNHHAGLLAADAGSEVALTRVAVSAPAGAGAAVPVAVLDGAVLRADDCRGADDPRTDPAQVGRYAPFVWESAAD